MSGSKQKIQIDSDARLAAELHSLNAVLAETSKESNRSQAVIIGAELEHALLEILQKHLLPHSKKDDSLFEPNGPLGSFAARIDIAHRLGLIPEDWHHDLHLIRKIRNEFAHGKGGTNLEMPRIKSCIEKLLAGKAELVAHAEKFGKPAKFAPELLFSVATTTLLGQMKFLKFNITTVPQHWRKFTYQGNTPASSEVQKDLSWPDFDERLNKTFPPHMAAGGPA